MGHPNFVEIMDVALEGTRGVVIGEADACVPTGVSKKGAWGAMDCHQFAARHLRHNKRSEFREEGQRL